MAVGTTSKAEWREVEIEAAAPHDPSLYPVLLDRVVDRLTDESPDSTRALALAGQVVLGTPWAGFRTGRARLASAAAAYITWLAPPEPWSKVAIDKVAGRRPIGWASSSGDVIVDVLAVGPREVRSLARKVTHTHHDVMAARCLDMNAPTRSLVYVAGSLPTALFEGPWDFGGRVR